MAEIDGGALSFKSVMDNDQINTAIEETLRRVQGLSDGTVAGGKKMDAAFDATADSIRNALGQIGTACEMHEKELQNLESEYQRLGQKASAAFMAGRDEEYNAITNQQTAIKGEITVREKLLQELRDQSDELEKVAQKQEENRQKTEENANTQTSMRSRIKALREEMMLLVDQGIDEQSDAYQRLKNELGRLIDIQGDVAQQGRTLANDEQKFQGIITGLSGLAGGFSAVTGAVSLFAGENEDLNKVMTKVQSVMAITIGLQQVAQTLNKDSAFQLVTMNSLKEWWRNVVVQATVAETAETVATTANTAAQEANAAATAANTASEVTNTVATGAQATAATAGTVANIGLAGAFRLVGVAIKSIPVFGWIIAGITALAAGIYALTSKQREAKKAQEEFTKSVVDGAYKSIGSVQFLSQQWKALGNDMDAKKKFIEQHKKAFDELGVSILDVADAEKLLNSGTKNFIDAQIAKAKAAALLKNSEDLVKQSIEADQELNAAKKTPKVTRYASMGMYVAGYSYQVDNPAIKDAQEKQTEANTKLRGLYAQAAVYEKEGADLMTKVGIAATKKYAAGTVGAIEQAIDAKKKALDGLKGDNKAYIKTTQDIEKLQKQLDKLTGKETKTTTTKDKTKDPFSESLEARKKKYADYYKWVNAGLQKEAQSEFASILEKGKTYKDYLQGMLDSGKLTKEQTHQVLNEIAGETNKTIIDTFKESLSRQIDNSKSVLDQLTLIQQKRDDLKNDDDPLKQQKNDVLDEEYAKAEEKRKQETLRVLEEYGDVNDQKIDLDVKYYNDLDLLKKQKESALTNEDKQRIERTIANRKSKYNEDKQNLLKSTTDAKVKLIELSRDNTLFEISKKSYLFETDRQKSILETQKKAAQETLNEFKKLQNEASTDELAAQIERVTLEIDVMNVELEKLPNEKFQEALSGLKKITSALSGLDGEVGEIFSGISSQLDNISIAFDKTATTTDKVSAGISGIVDIINMVSAASAERNRVEKEYYQNQIALAHEYALALNNVLLTQSELSGGGFVTDYAGKINNGFEAMSDVTKNYQEALGKLSEGKAKIDLRNSVDWGNVGKGAAAGAVSGAAIGSIVPVIGTAIGAVAGAIIGGLSGLFGGKKKKAEYGGLLDVFPELVDSAGNLNKELAKTLINTKQVDDKTKQLIQNALDWSDAIETANAQIKEVVVDLAGDLGNSLKDSIVEAWKAGEDASKKMFDAAGESLEKFVEDLLYSTIFSEVFDEFADRLAESLSPNGDGDILDDYDWLMGEMDARDDYFINLLEQVKNRAKEKGYDLWNDEADAATNSSLTGAVKGVSEATASMVGGQMNAMRINQLEATAILRQQLAALSVIANNTSYNYHLAKLERIVSLLEAQSGNSLRSQGLS